MRTVQSIIIQKEISFKIIITDDGSKINHTEKLRNYFKDIKVIKRYLFLYSDCMVATSRFFTSIKSRFV